MNDLRIEELREFATEFVAAEPDRLGRAGFWQKPLLVSAPIDARFEILPQIAFNEHLHPHDLLPTARSLLVFFIPFKRELIEENKKGDRPCRNWGLAYVRTNDLIERLSQALEQFLMDKGFQSGLTPATHNFDEDVLMARWSHKHLAYLANLGRFGTHCMLITPAGCTGRLGSLVTEADLGDHPLMDTREACLLKAGHKCGECIQACPVNALKTQGIERRTCWNRLNENRDTLSYLSDLPESTHVCGKCAALMPCSFLNPVAEL
ncbi:MAG: epoxyqueuosine reductase [Deltaproteobacteria bacterium]|jgi:epoxyqueuosine reductase QueG|nr:epoxyqueuosine reductase [Deltaproteobacteria bacterium]